MALEVTSTAPAQGARVWQELTPAVAIDLTDHLWSVSELLKYKVGESPLTILKKRGRPAKTQTSPLALGVKNVEGHLKSPIPSFTV